MGNTPYRLLFGQLPRVNISALLLDPILLNTMATGAELNQLVDLPTVDNTVEGNDEIAEMDILNEEDGVKGNGNDAIPYAEIVNEDAVDAIPEAEIVVVVLVDDDDDDDDDDGSESSSFATANDNVAMSSTSIDLFGAGVASSTLTTSAAAGGSHDSDSDDEHLTLSELGRQAEKSGQFKTTGDKDFTAWQVLRLDLSDAVVVDCEYLQSRKIRDKVPIAFCLDEGNITKMESFVPAILVRVGKTQWELMDENNDEMEQMEWDGDNGIGNMVGMYMYIKHVDKAFCDYFKTMDNCLKLT